MKKPARDAHPAVWRRYLQWVQAQLDGHTPDDPTIYVPRYDGIQALEPEEETYVQPEPTDDD